MRRIKRFYESTKDNIQIIKSRLNDDLQELMEFNYQIEEVSERYLSKDISEKSDIPKKGYHLGYYVILHGLTNMNMSDYIESLNCLYIGLGRLDNTLIDFIIYEPESRNKIKFYFYDSNELVDGDHDYDMEEFKDYISRCLHRASERMDISSDRLKENTRIIGDSLVIDMSKTVGYSESRDASPAQIKRFITNLKEQIDSHRYTFPKVDIRVTGKLIHIKFINMCIYHNHKMIDISKEARFGKSLTADQIEQYKI